LELHFSNNSLATKDVHFEYLLELAIGRIRF